MASEARPAPLAHHFDDYDQQRESATLGMWLFLAQEVMFFGGLFLAYTVYRWKYPAWFALGSNQLDVPLGLANTIVLIGSSLTMVLAVRAAQLGRARQIAGWLGATMALIFLSIVPVIIFYLCCQKHIIKGVAAGAVKG